MNRSTISRAFFAAATSAAFLWTLALSASPQLHQRIHSNANQNDHVCAVTIVTTGKVHHAPPAAISVPAPLVDLAPIAQLSPARVQPLFLIAAVFEHAPPAYS
jgi:hypothetical protein